MGEARPVEQSWQDTCSRPAMSISFNEFQAQEKQAFSSLSQNIDKSVQEFTKEKLRVIGYSQDKVEELAKSVLDEGLEIYENANLDSEDIQQLNTTADAFSLLYDRVLFLIVAPKGATETRDLCLEEDAKARRFQYEHFCDIYPGIKENPEKNPAIEPINVFQYSTILHELKVFFQSYGSKCRKAIIVFNGHGNSNGMTFENEHEAIPVDTYLADIKKILDKNSKFLAGVRVPCALDVILAQCYSHCFSSPPKDDTVSVIPLTNQDRETTSFTMKRRRDAQGFKWVLDSTHVELNLLAEETRKEEGTKGPSVAAKGDGPGGDKQLSPGPNLAGDMNNIIEGIEDLSFNS